MAIKITYNGKTTELADGYIATLPCKDLKMETDVVVEAPEPVEEESGGGAELNIAYGDTAPEDTSKLWVKTTQPSAVKVSSEFTYRGSGESFETLSATTSPILRGNVSAVVGNKIYMLMGNAPSGWNKAIHCFDTETETVTTLSATMPIPTYDGGGVAVGTRIYTFGGIGSGGGNYTVHCFDTETETVTALSSSQAYFGAGLWVEGTMIYGYATQSPSVFALDTTTNTLTRKTMSYTYRRGRASAKVGKTVYLFGGKTGSNNSTAVAEIYKVDVEATQETLLPVTLPQPAVQTASVVMGTLIYLFGGVSSASVYLDTVLCFDTKTETISTCPVTTPEAMFGEYAAQSTPKGIYVIGGNKTNDKVWKFTAELEVLLGNGEMQIEPSLTDNTFNLINTDTIKAEIGVNKVYKGNAEGIGEQVEASLHNGATWVTI